MNGSYLHVTSDELDGMSAEPDQARDGSPTERETEFTIQQVWDAHICRMQALKPDRSVVFGERFIADFQRLARARGEKLVLRVPTGDIFFRAWGWPVLTGARQPGRVMGRHVMGRHPAKASPPTEGPPGPGPSRRGDL